MSVHRLEREMTAQEVTEWFAHFDLSARERKRAADKAKAKRGRV